MLTTAAVARLDGESATAAPVADRQDHLANDSDLAGQRAFTRWIITLFVIGAGLCIVSFVLFYLFNGLQQGNMQPVSATEWIVNDNFGGDSRTVSAVEVFFKMFMGQVAPLLCLLGAATIVANFFRMAARHPSSRSR